MPRSGNSNTVIYKDFFGQHIAVGDIVMGAYNVVRDPTLALYTVVGLTEKSVKVIRVGTTKPKAAYRRPDNVYKVDPKLLTLRGISK